MRYPAPLLSAFLIVASTRLVHALDIEWVTVGDPGNPPDVTGYGAVASPFQISKHEITVGQYAEFLTAVGKKDPIALWSSAQKIDRRGPPGQFEYIPRAGIEREPVMHVSFLDAMRFANWVHHQQSPPNPALVPTPEAPPHPTESGAYDLTTEGAFAARSKDARAWIPNENEWYKAAYFQPASADGPLSHYWLYPTRSDQPPTLGKPGDTAPNLANFLANVTPQPNGDILRHYNDVMPVGSFPGSPSPYGTLDQGGNAWEWIEATVFNTQRGIRGGHMCGSHEKLRSTVRSSASPSRRYPDTGFRLARPEPTPAKPTFSSAHHPDPSPLQPQ